jgi:outer membrane autotransporter protein
VTSSKELDLVVQQRPERPLLESAGTVVVGSATTVDTLTITGAYTQTSTGTLTLEVGGPDAGIDFDQLVVDGSATLDGTLVIQLVNGFLPNSGDQFTVLTCAAENGAFAQLGGDGGRFTALYDPMDVTLEAN